MTAPPLIGLTTAIEPRLASPWNDGAAVVRLPYLRQVALAGGVAVLLPPTAPAVAGPEHLLDRLDAVVLTGGPDIDPVHYGAERDPRTRVGPAERDDFELTLTRRAIQRGIPLLGICRGMQLLNVALGGTLHQHLPDVVGHGRHHRTSGSVADDDYDAPLAPGSLAASAAGEELIRATDSQHHQGVDRIGEGLRVSGWAAIDGLPVALELASAGFVLGVQWHPEVDERSQVIAALVDAARGQ